MTGIRAFAAWWVVSSHLRYELAKYFPAAKDFSKFLVGGHLGVDLFFILSGFIISYNYAHRFRTFEIRSYARFLWLRLARVYPVHLFTLLAMVVLVFALESLGWPYKNPEVHTLESFVRHLLMVNGWAYPLIDRSWNFASWSVSAEWLAYLVFPALIIATSRIGQQAWALGLALSALVVVGVSCSLLPYSDTLSYGILRLAGGFFAGCMLFKLYEASWVPQHRWSAVAAGALLIAVVGSTASRAWGATGLHWVTPFLAIVVYALAWDRGAFARLLSRPWVVRSGRSSYSLYMTHGVVLFVIRYFLYNPELTQGSAAVRGLILFSYVAAIAIVAELTHAYVEVPARRWMAAMFPEPNDAAEPADLSVPATAG